MHDAGKGDSSRPLSVSKEQFASNWDAIFGKKSKATEVQSKASRTLTFTCPKCGSHAYEIAGFMNGDKIGSCRGEAKSRLDSVNCDFKWNCADDAHPFNLFTYKE